jgi:hypothetical protein
MGLGTPIRAAVLAGLAAYFAGCPLGRTPAGATELEAPQTIVVAASDYGSRAVALGVVGRPRAAAR